MRNEALLFYRCKRAQNTLLIKRCFDKVEEYISQTFEQFVLDCQNRTLSKRGLSITYKTLVYINNQRTE